ncbi:MAG: galactose-1-phosphate uridylyltransferase [Candidatus Micrarchaeota archaeon]
MPNELRKDPLFERYAIIAEARGKRPTDFALKRAPCESKPEGICYFCPGNEHLTPPEISRITEKGKKGWIVRCFPNKFPAVSRDSPRAYGYHEIIVETNKHGATLSELSTPHIKKVLDMYASRVLALHKDKKIKYVLIFKNEGEEGGASLSHTHTQLIALAQIPPVIEDEIRAQKKFKRSHKKCALCELAKKEKNSERAVYENDEFVCFAPYASRFSFETWVLPKKHIPSLAQLTEKQKLALADALKNSLGKLDKLLNRPPYNYLVHIAPARGREYMDFHFHIEICPRLARWAGFEFGSGIMINSMPPETAAKALRGTRV